MKRGFMLIELIIAVSLASLVMVSVAIVTAEMARNQINGIRSGSVAGWSAMSYVMMTKEIESANVLAFPINDGDGADEIVICKNWSRIAGNTLDSDPERPVSVIQYCVDPTPAVPPETGFRLRRYARTGIGVTCPGGPVACNAAGPPGWGENDVVGFRLEKLPGFGSVFWRDNSIGGVRVRYAIGQQTATAEQPVAKFMTFDFAISMQKPYNNTLD